MYFFDLSPDLFISLAQRGLHQSEILFNNFFNMQLLIFVHFCRVFIKNQSVYQSSTSKIIATRGAKDRIE